MQKWIGRRIKLTKLAGQNLAAVAVQGDGVTENLGCTQVIGDLPQAPAFGNGDGDARSFGGLQRGDNFGQRHRRADHKVARFQLGRYAADTHIGFKEACILDQAGGLELLSDQARRGARLNPKTDRAAVSAHRFVDLGLAPLHINALHQITATGQEQQEHREYNQF